MSHLVFAQPVLHEVPLMVEAPGLQELVPAYHDGEQFFVNAARLFKILGYHTAVDSTHIELHDAVRRYRVELADREVPLVRLDILARSFGADMFFDEKRLSLMLSSAAERFDTRILVPQTALPGQAPGPLRYGRQRRILGGAVAAYDVTWGGRREVVANTRYTVSTLGGSLQGEAGSLSYMLDLPFKRVATSVTIARTRYSREVRLSNSPLGSQHLHRRSSIGGRTEPHALVEAAISGVVVDRVVADSGGRYRLVVPIYYGSTDVTVLHRSPASGGEREERHHVFTAVEQVEHKRLYYDAVFTRDRTRLTTSYGLLPRLTLRAEGEEYHYQRLWLGAVASPWRSTIAAFDIDAISSRLRAQMYFVQPRMRADVSYTSERRQLRALLTGHHRGLNGLFAASVDVSGSLVQQRASYFGQTGVTAEVGYSRQHYRSLPVYQHLRAMVGHAGMVGHVAGRVSAGVTQGRHLQLWVVEGHASLRRVSLGVNTTYDARQKSVHVGATLRANIGIAALGSNRDGAGHHMHTLSGSVAIGPRVHLSDEAVPRSSAILRIYEDRNGNNQLDRGELLPEVEAQLFHATLRRTTQGTLRAHSLESFTAYQVQILASSIRDPMLHPLPGYTFSFLADPGQTKIIDIPLVRPAHIAGRVAIWDRAASRLEVKVLQDADDIASAPIYRDGGFSLRLSPGRYMLQLRDVVSGEILAVQELMVPPAVERMEVAITVP